MTLPGICKFPSTASFTTALSGISFVLPEKKEGERGERERERRGRKGGREGRKGGREGREKVRKAGGI